MLLIIILASCSVYQYSVWSEEDGVVIIQLDEVDQSVETYYADITLQSGSRIAVPLGKPDAEKKFKVENNFGKFTDLQIYTDKDVP